MRTLLAKIIAVLWREIRRGWWTIHHLFGGGSYADFGLRQIGLGNRLKGLANLYAWEGSKKITLRWGMDDWVPERFEDLFEMRDAPGFRCASYLQDGFSRMLLVPYPLGHTRLFWQFYSHPRWAGLPARIDFLYHRTPQVVWEKYKPFFDQLRPSAKVMARVGECRLPESYVAVHIRNSLRKNDPKNVCTLEAVIDAMRGYPEKTVFFISCMEKTIAERFVAEFRERVVELPCKNYYSMIDAVADMWLLGQGQEIVCSSGSTFPEVAWWWGGDLNKKAKILQETYRQA